MCSLENKVALVTGAAQGIGRGIALELATAGANIVIADLNREKAKSVSTEITTLGRHAIGVQLDVTDMRSVKAGAKEAIKQFGYIDILVNNAGICPEKLLADSTAKDFDICYEVNLKGIWSVTMALVPHFKERREGKIINIASTAGRKGSGYVPAYCASKAGVISLTQSLASALGPDNINVNAVCPGLVKTPLTEKHKNEVAAPTYFEGFVEQHTLLKRLITPEDIGHAVVFLASSQAKNITGQSLNVNAGEYLN